MAAQDAAGITLNARRNYKRLTRANGLAIVYLSATVATTVPALYAPWATSTAATPYTEPVTDGERNVCSRRN